MDSDRPVRRRKDDRLGFGPVAVHLARTIIEQAAADGLVFGIEGKWGSGKSTLLNLTANELRNLGDAAPEIIEFSPWLVGNRDDLIRQLFDELAAAAVRIDPVEDARVPDSSSLTQRIKERIVGDKHAQLQRKETLKKSLGSKLWAFGNVAGGLARLAKASGAVGVPYADSVGTALEQGGAAIGGIFNTTSMSKRKSEIVGALKLLSRRIVIFVDDLDRLEPREASEVLRLVRAVADFPNVIYILSYDPAVLSKTLQQAVQIDDGISFLEKIVQVSFRVPRPEAFDLRRWFQTEVSSLFSEELGASDDRQRPMRDRSAQAIDREGGRYLNTPRDVVRALNALRLQATPIRSRIDISDMIWLQLVRIGNHKLYAWVEEYLTDVSAIHSGAGTGDNAGRDMARRLEKILEAENQDIDRAMFELSQWLPGLDGGIGQQQHRDGRRVYNNLDGNTLNRFISSRRLGSPQHYRYYFAFSEPAGALRDEEVQAFIDFAQRQPGEAIKLLHSLANKARPQGGVMAEVLIDRIISAADQVPAIAVCGILCAFSTVLDTVARLTPDREFGEPAAWRSARKATRMLLKLTPQEDRHACLRQLFGGPSLGWLASLLRSEIFSHGRYGDNAKPESDRLLTPSEFDDVLTMMLNRFRRTPSDELVQVPNLMSLLYGWMQGGGGDDARQWVKSQTETDTGLLDFLSRARGWAADSRIGVYYPLKKHDLQHFLDYDETVRRVRALSGDSTASEPDRHLARELLVAIEQGQEDKWEDSE